MTDNPVPNNYDPLKDKTYMSEAMCAFFHQRLLEWRQELVESTKTTMDALQNDSLHVAESMERATMETDKALELRTKDRVAKLVLKIDQAVKRIESDDFGYCLVTGEEIGVKRLIARPIATMTVEAQESKERREKFHSDE